MALSPTALFGLSFDRCLEATSTADIVGFPSSVSWGTLHTCVPSWILFPESWVCTFVLVELLW